MKALVILVLACAIFGASGYFTYKLFVKPQLDLKEEKAAPATPAPPEPTLPEFNKCMALKRQGKLVEARAALYDYVDHNPQSSILEQARAELGDVNTRIFLSPIQTPEKGVYLVKSGDVITRVAQKNHSSPELIMKANALNGVMLRIGQKLLLPPANFSIIISRKQNKVIVNNDNRFFKEYAILKWPPQIPPYKKGGPPQAKQTGKVIEKIAWLDGTRVIFTDKGYDRATHWIAVTIKHCTLYAEPPPNADPNKMTRPGSGIALSPRSTAELGAMLLRGNPVTLE
ncbi:MAG TPA: LysM peptidoglycan-binding domain-containing protein [Chthoniobacteraceae bacterium]|nr:LysM peptidoglycan-binding domain-containing protein [Chthoniobacteraceae bacterium]